MTIYNIVTFVALVPIKLLITFGSLTLASIVSIVVNRNTDPKKPLPAKRSKAFYIGNAILGRLLCLGHGLLVIEKNKHYKNRSAHVLCGNHCSYLDAMVMSTIGGGSAVANQGMADFWFLRQILKISRALIVTRQPHSDDSQAVVQKRLKTTKEFGLSENHSITQQMQQRVDQMNEGVTWPQILIFPEGTISNNQVLLKFRTSVFTLQNCKIQPFALKYKTVFDISWLTNSGKSAMMRSFLNLFGIIEITYLPVVERQPDQQPQQFADMVGKQIAHQLKCTYTDYKNDDIGYFMGWKSKENCTEAYLRDFGYLGQLKDVRKKLYNCKKVELFQEDIELLFQK